MSDIFLRLPMETLLTCRSVSKEWYALLTGPNFLELHLRYRTSKAAEKLVSLLQPLGPVNAPISLCIRDEEASATIPLPFPFDRGAHIEIMGSCNGLVCAVVCGSGGTGMTIVLCNPASTQYRFLGTPQYGSQFDSFGHFGFGFLEDTHDYKIVMFPDGSSGGSTIILVSLYTLSLNTWKVVQVLVPVPNPSLVAEATFLNGFLHWMAAAQGNQLIVSFDLRNEAFGRILLPDSLCSDDSLTATLLVLNGSLSVTVHLWEECNSFDIWVMAEYGVEESWTKHFSIGPFPIVVWPVGSWKNSQLVFEYLKEHYSYELFRCDPDAQEIVQFRAPGNTGKWFKIFNYVASLESVSRRFFPIRVIWIYCAIILSIATYNPANSIEECISDASAGILEEANEGNGDARLLEEAKEGNASPGLLEEAKEGTASAGLLEEAMEGDAPGSHIDCKIEDPVPNSSHKSCCSVFGRKTEVGITLLKKHAAHRIRNFGPRTSFFRQIKKELKHLQDLKDKALARKRAEDGKIRPNTRDMKRKRNNAQTDGIVMKGRAMNWCADSNTHDTIDRLQGRTAFCKWPDSEKAA
ncbi:hypothetical protein RJ639_046569 [Escallonia herrerae]|uniref:F-box domain-containing protein n=1 Tax=Escallonia herrerae TaxID=1293975 RepID=A0AA88W3Y3_9ASTE|nr:hypothetical protein RJ639_046569 [Escallonia herrerae]